MAYPSPSDVPVAENMDSQPRILLLGLRSSGKSSIQKVVFHKMPPGDTMNLESTNQIVKEDITSGSFIQFQIWDCPGQNDFSDSSLYDLDYIFGTRGALIFVIDAQDDCNEALRMLNRVFTNAYNVNKNLKFEVFIHKIDGIPEDQKLELQRYILYTASEELKESGIHGLHLSIHLTSIYDHTIFEAFSKVVQKLVKSLSVLENMLTMFSNNSGVDKVFLFDIVSKIYIATDVNQVENELYELCCDMIDVTLDISCVYGEGDDDVENSGFDHESGALIRLNTNFVLYLREVNRHLAVVCIISDTNFQRRGTIDYNFGILRKKINDILEANKNLEKLKNNSAAVEDANGDDDLSNNVC
ncbi:hypothetical protein HELRODRAFT_164696 [Helobdella robusta]|uniref:Ras-related GTP-binding protein n=1 Tax=Helobdella robusta TaxID=6412 RepID=T1EVQ6_HELRO|nr:hypothetical protein HELRODRAFT_164696 [Helobdella robusta]ESN92620.1 hypothetical protein HELRODRAFT_164696 [Helobdella robusta]